MELHNGNAPTHITLTNDRQIQISVGTSRKDMRWKGQKCKVSDLYERLRTPIRLHKFGDEDDEAKADTPSNRLPSFKSMCEFACRDPKVAVEYDSERLKNAAQDFAGIAQDETCEWRQDIARNSDGKPLSTIDNCILIMRKDPLLRGKFALNVFSGRGEVLGELPWESSGKRRMWSDTDSNGLYWYMEKAYSITRRGNIDAALDLHAAKNRFNDVQNYLNGLTWDGVQRLDRLFVDYLGAEDCSYTRAVTRKAFAAAVARAMAPGTKFDCMTILCGPQGIGKSTLIDRMSKGWYNDSIRTFEGKDASELLQGVWLVEVAELDAFRRTDVARIKQFLSLRADRYRAAYGRTVRDFPRRCVFFGTCNQMDFLQDTTGNRRFWPVDVGINSHSKTVWRDLTDVTVDQLWAEAKAYWQVGEGLFLTGNLEAEAQEKQEQHRDADPREGLVADFSLQRVPRDWSKWPLDRRRDFWATQANGDYELVERESITAIEVWCELFNGNIANHRSADMKVIRAALDRMPEWIRTKAPFHAGNPYGTQRGYRRKSS